MILRNSLALPWATKSGLCVELLEHSSEGCTTGIAEWVVTEFCSSENVTAPQPQRIGCAQGIVLDITIPVPGLRIARTHRAHSCRVRRGPAALGRRELAEHEVSEITFRIPVLTGEVQWAQSVPVQVCPSPNGRLVQVSTEAPETLLRARTVPSQSRWSK